MSFLKTLPSSARLLGLDIGTKTIGLAVASLCYRGATVLPVLKRNKFIHDIDSLKKIVQEWDIQGLVVGLPLHMNGQAGTKVQSVKNTTSMIAKALGLAYDFQDERLSTSSAYDSLMGLPLTHKQRHTLIDSHAAKVILEDYLAVFHLLPEAYPEAYPEA